MIIAITTPPKVKVGSCKVSRECIVMLMKLNDIVGNAQTNNEQAMETIVVVIRAVLITLFVSNIYITFFLR